MSFLGEIKRRKVPQAAAVYLIGAWLTLQISDVVIPALFLPGWIVSLVLYLLILAFPLVVVLAWHFDLTPEGLKQDARVAGRGLGGLKAGIAFSAAFAIVGAASIYLYGYLADRATTQDIAEVQPSSLAVLPFVNVSEDADEEYFSEGITEELINVLSRIPGLQVTAQTSSFQFSGSPGNAEIQDIARQLGVATIVTGRIQRAENSVRVTAKLINATTGFQMWSESFDQELTDIFAIQDEIAKAIGDSLQLRFIQEGAIEPTVTRAASIDAYNLYLLGRFHYKKRSVFELEQAKSYFEEAIGRDPAYAPAYNGLVNSILSLSDDAFGSVPLEQSIAAALPLIERSLELDPLLAETHASLGLLRMFEWDTIAAEAALKRAIELSPNLSQAYLWLYVTYDRSAQHENAFEALQRTFALDPLSPIVNANMSAEYWIRSRTAEALDAANRIVQIASDTPLGYRRAGRIKWTSGDLSEAVDLYLQSLQAAPEDRNSQLELGALLVDLGLYDDVEGLLGDQRYIAYLAQGRVEDALAVTRDTLRDRPRHINTVFEAVYAEAWAGNFHRVRELLEPFSEGADSGKGQLFLRSGIHFWDPQIAAMDLVVALFETGEAEAATVLLSQVNAYFDNLTAEGLDHPMLDFQQARILALEGNTDEVLKILRHILAAGWRFWYLEGDPALKNVRELREFQSIVRDRDMLVQIERDEVELL